MPLRDTLILGLPALALASTLSTAQPNFDWSSITPSPDLQYHSCYNDFHCARLQLPLDWKNATDPRTVSIAIVKLPAKVPPHDPTFGGSVFTNPGGPGGSGVSFLTGRGHYLRDYVDTPGRKHYEVVSFDPRGVGNSAPMANCFPGSVLARDAWMLEVRGNGGLGRGAWALAHGLAMFDAFGRRCEGADEGGLNGGQIFEYLGTPSVARDMVAMVDAVDALRKKGSRAGNGDGERAELRKRDDGDVARLQYIGFSYGTILGNYFASLFPGRVGRIVLDGVCNADDYASGPGWLTNTVDSDEIFQQHLKGCFDAGPQVCALARADDKSASDIASRFWTWLKRLDEEPVVGTGPSGNAVVVTGADVLTVVALASYTPIKTFVNLAKLLDNAMAHHDYDAVFAAVEAGLGTPLQEACPVNGTTTPNQGSDPLTAVLCLDGQDNTRESPAWWKRYIEKQVSQSSVFGTLWAGLRFACSGWRFKPRWSFHGPFTTPEATAAGEKLQEGRPAAPLMFVTNRLDPVTPLSAARAMAEKHRGAKVVVQDAMGHCAVFSAYSQCMKRAVAGYFDTGKVPDGEVVCEAECGPWDAGCGRVFASVEGDGEDEWLKRRFPLGVL